MIESVVSIVVYAVQMLVIGGLVLGILVFVHELGHFLVAKACGIKVLTFSLGFGKPLVKWTKGETEYRISSIPFGGYVNMAAEHPEDERSGDEKEFTSKPIWQRALVAVGGPAANYLFSLGLLWVMILPGEKRPLYLDSTTIGSVEQGSPAQRAGVAPGDSIVAMNGAAVSTWDDIQKAFSTQERTYAMTVVRDSGRETMTLEMAAGDGSHLPKYPLGGVLPKQPTVIGRVLKGQPAEAAGFQVGDSVRMIGGQQVTGWYDLTRKVMAFDSTQERLVFSVKRDGQVVQLPVVPRYDTKEKRYVIGVTGDEGPTRTVSYTPVGALGKAVERSGEYALMIFVVVKKLATGAVSPTQLAGPIGIVQMSGTVALLSGLMAILNLIVLVGINLAVLNLLPLIITDGGMLLFLLIEAIRGRPLSLKHQLLLNRIAVAFFVALFVYVTLNDINRGPELFRLLPSR